MRLSTVGTLLAVAILLTACARRKQAPTVDRPDALNVSLRDAGPPPPPDVVLVASTGLRAQPDGLARRATAIDRLRLTAAPGAVVIVDAGDAVPTALLALGRIGVAALVPDEAELALGVARLRALAAGAKVPLVAANLVDGRGKRVFDASRIVETPHARVGLVGVVAPGAVPRGLRATDPVAAAQEELAALKANGVEVRIAIVPSDVAGLLPDATLVVARADLDPGAVDAWAFARTSVDAGPQDFRSDKQRIPLDPSIPEQLGVRVLLTLAAGGPPDMRRKDPPPQDWTFGSSGACALCHADETAQWKSTAHADALDTLGKRADDPACLVCHTTSFLLPGGTSYVATAKKYFAAVGCESCHGPSVAHVRNPRKPGGTSRKVAAEVCLGCHTPDQLSEPFDHARLLSKVLGPGHGR